MLAEIWLPDFPADLIRMCCHIHCFVLLHKDGTQMEEIKPTPRTTVNRMRKRGTYDREVIHAILDRVAGLPRRRRRRRRAARAADAACADRRSRLHPRRREQPHAPHRGGGRRDLPDRDADRRAGDGALGLSSFGELSLGGDLRRRDGGDRSRAQACRDARAGRAHRAGPMGGNAPSRIRRNSRPPRFWSFRSPRRRRRCAPAGRSTTRRTTPCPSGPA